MQTTTSISPLDQSVKNVKHGPYCVLPCDESLAKCEAEQKLGTGSFRNGNPQCFSTITRPQKVRTDKDTIQGVHHGARTSAEGKMVFSSRDIADFPKNPADHTMEAHLLQKKDKLCMTDVCPS